MEIGFDIFPLSFSSSVSVGFISEIHFLLYDLLSREVAFPALPFELTVFFLSDPESNNERKRQSVFLPLLQHIRIQIKTDKRGRLYIYID